MLPDEVLQLYPTMEAVRGVGRTPAYRGLCFVMLTNFEITEYGGQNQNFQFELIEGGAALTDVSTSVYGVSTVERKEMVWHYAVTTDNKSCACRTFASWDNMYLTASARAVASAYYGGDADTQSVQGLWQATSLGGNGIVFSYGDYNGTGLTYSSTQPAVLADKDRYVRVSNAAANTVTIPTNASVVFAIGTQITVRQSGAGKTTIAGATGVTVNSAATLALRAQHSTVSLLKVGVDEWDLAGDVA